MFPRCGPVWPSDVDWDLQLRVVAYHGEVFFYHSLCFVLTFDGMSPVMVETKL